MTLAFTCSLLLAACDTPADMKKAKQEPVSLQKQEAVKDLPLPAVASGDDKLAKLEQQVAELQKEVAANRPKIAKIDVMEQRFKDLSLGLDRIDATYNMKPAPVVAPPVVALPPVPAKPVEMSAPVKAPEKTAPKAEAPKREAMPGGKVVKDLRIGEKAGISRLVLDLGQPVKITYDIDNDEKILVIDIPGFKWDPARSRSFEKSPLIASYQVESDDKGSHLVVQLKKPSKIASYSSIQAVSGKMPRAVLDIAAQ